MTDEERPEPASETTGRRHPLRWIVLVPGLLALILVLLVAGILLALRSETGTAWVIQQVPGLSVQSGRGSLLGNWQARHLHWQGYGITLDLVAPRIDWSPSCLLQKQVCLDTLHADRITVTTAPSDSDQGASAGLQLPTLDIPVSIRLADVQLGPFELNQSRIWDRFELEGAGSGADWSLGRVSYRLADYAVTASGQITTRGDWPVDLDVQASLPPPEGDRWLVNLQLAGSVRSLRVNGTSKGYLSASLAGQVSPLDPALPAQLTVRSDQFRGLSSLPSTLAFSDIRIEAKGSLKNGFQTQGQATLPGTAGPVDLALSGLLTTAGARDTTLKLSGRGPSAGTVRLQGSVHWLEGIRAQADLTMDHFPWFTLIPEMAEPAIELKTLTGQLSLEGREYQATLHASTDGPQGAADIDTSLNGDFQSVTVSELKLSSEAGSLTGQGKVGFDGPLTWNAALDLSGFNPGTWFPMLEASLNGQVRSEGSWQSGAIPEMTANWNLKGTWRTHDTRATGNVDTRSGRWLLSDFELLVGNNRVSGSGAWGDQIEGDLSLDAPSPEQLLAGLEGQLQGQIHLGGTRADPTGNLSLKGQELAWQGKVALDDLDATASLAEGQRLTAELKGKGLAAGGQRIDTVTLNATGTEGAHTLKVDLQQDDATVALSFSGGFESGWSQWQGRLASGRIDIASQNQQWLLQSPASLSWQGGKQVRFGAHCWAWQQSSVCAEEQQLWPQPDIAYRIERFPASALSPLLPETLRWESELNGQVALTLSDAGPRGHIRVDAGSGKFEVLVDGDWQSLGYQTFVTELNLEPDVARLAVNLAGKGLGDLNLDLSVDPSSPDREIDGKFSLAGLDVAVAGVFTRFKEVAGEINGQGRLSGPLMNPEVTGQLALTDGRVMDPSLPVPMENIVMQMDLKGHSADISGRIRSNARSETILDGSLDWTDGWKGRVAVKGSRVPLNIEPYAHLEVGPDLAIEFSQGRLSVSGDISVPRGSIEIQSLPDQAVQVSDDEVVVGVETEKPAIRSMNMDVTVRVGADEVSFSAFGITGNLEGTLRIGNDMDTRGTLQLVKGHYEAYGQELELRQARLLFVGNLTQPYLDVEAIREVGSVTAGLRLSGPVRSPSTEVFSTPDMPQTDALSYLILGRAPQSQGDRGQMNRAALSLGLTQASKLTGKVGEELGIRNLALEAEGTGDQTSVVASGYLTDDLSVRYGVGIFQPITTVALRYDLGKYFYLEAASGLAASLDIFYTRDF